jgi:hypothetical protein
LSVVVGPDDLRPENPALFVTYTGRGAFAAATQHLLLPSGRYVLTGRRRLEADSGDGRLSWRISCTEGGRRLANLDVPQSESPPSGWGPFTVGFVVPAEACPAQTISLVTRPAARRAPMVAWFDDIAIRVSSSESSPGA